MNRLTVAGIVVLVVGLLLVGGGVYFSLAQEAGIADVRQVQGEVVSATVEPVEDGYYPNVTYRYTVDGQTYVSSNVFPPAGERRGAERDEAAEIVRGYRAGQSVTVYVRPEDPAAASLRAPRDPGPVFAFGFGLVTVFSGFTLFVAGRQRDRGVDFVQDDSPLDMDDRMEPDDPREGEEPEEPADPGDPDDQ